MFMIKTPDGLFSKGGSCPRLVPFKKGKVWRQLGHVHLHLHLHLSQDRYSLTTRPKDLRYKYPAGTQVIRLITTDGSQYEVVETLEGPPPKNPE